MAFVQANDPFEEKRRERQRALMSTGLENIAQGYANYEKIKIEQAKLAQEKETKNFDMNLKLWDAWQKSPPVDVNGKKRRMPFAQFKDAVKLAMGETEDEASGEMVAQAPTNPAAPEGPGGLMGLMAEAETAADIDYQNKILQRDKLKNSMDPKVKEADRAKKLEDMKALADYKAKLDKNPVKGAQLPPNQVLNVNEGLTLPKDFEDLYLALDKNKDIFGPVEGRLKSKNPYDEKGQTLEGLFSTSSQKYGRFMEGGVLKKEDEIKYRRMFPQVSDTPAVARNKLIIADRKLKLKIKSDLEALKGAGYDVSGFSSNFEVPELPGVISNEIIPSSYAEPPKIPDFKNMTDQELDEYLNRRK